VGNVSTNVYAKFRYAPLHMKKTLGIFRELITTTTTIVAFWDPPSNKNNLMQCQVRRRKLALALVGEQTLFVDNSLPSRQPMQFIANCLADVVELPFPDDQASSGVDHRL